MRKRRVPDPRSGEIGPVPAPNQQQETLAYSGVAAHM